VTNGSGLYSFTNLTPDSYYIEVTLPSGYIFTSQDQVESDLHDSNANTSTGRTSVTTLTAGEADTSWDAGMDKPVAIGKKRWNDDGVGGGIANDGILNGTEAGIS